MIKGRLAALLLMLGTASALAQPCNPSPTALCLSASRFEVKVAWTDFQNNTGDGQAIPLTTDTGYFWFFTNTNVELVIKVLDARAINGHFWVFYGALSNVQYEITVRDSQTGDVQIYDNPAGQFASTGDTFAFPPSATVSRLSTEARSATRLDRPVGHPVDESRIAPAAWNSAAACVPTSTALCLSGGRFRVEAAWKDFQGNTGAGQAVGLTSDTGYFWFFSSTNVEAVIKVLDARPINNYFWVFYGALSNVEYTLTVTDTVTGIVRTYANPSQLFASVGDTQAFGTPTTFQLIDGGVVKGEIDAETALLYKVYASFDDPRLPEAYVGDPPDQEGHGLMMEVVSRWPTLSAPTQQLLEPFLTPPIYAGSWFAAQSTVKASSPRATLDDWTKIPTAHTWIWYRAADAGAETAANNLAAEADNVWNKETNLMQREPLTDADKTNNGGDGKLDIYVLPSFRFGGKDEGRTLGYRDPLDYISPGPDYVARPGYILIRISNASTPEGARDVLAHEFFHTIALSYKTADGFSADKWLNEATATYMEDYVYPTQINNLEQQWARKYFLYGYKQRLDTPQFEGYEDYLFLFYVARSSTPVVVEDIWSHLPGTSALQAIDAAIPGGFSQRWPDFALDCWNQPDIDKFRQWDKLSSGLEKTAAVPYLEVTAGGGSTPLPSRTVSHLAMDYAYIHITGDSVKRLEVENQKVAGGKAYAKTQAWIKLADGTTRTEDWSGDDKERVVFCRDKASQKVEEIFIVYTNSGTVAPVVWNDGKVNYDSVGCGYHGTVHVERHDADGSYDETIDVTTTFVKASDDGLVYAAQQYTLTYKGRQVNNGCTESLGPVTHTFAPGDSFFAASVMNFDTSTNPATYWCLASFLIEGTETIVCPDGTTQRTSGAGGNWFNLPPDSPQQVKPDGSLSGTYTDGVRTWTWDLKPDVGDGP